MELRGSTIDPGRVAFVAGLVVTLWVGVGCEPVDRNPGPATSEGATEGREDSADEVDERWVDRVPKGERGVRLSFPVRRAVAGRIRGGDRVDVLGMFPGEKLGTFDAEVNFENVDGVLITLLLQNVSVLEVRNPERNAGDVVELIVSSTPAEQELLQVARRTGRLSLMLRHPDEPGIVPVAHRDSRLLAEEYRDRVSRRIERTDGLLSDCSGLEGRRKRRGCVLDEVRETDTGRFSDRIPSDERALTVTVGSATASAIGPGDRIDLIGTFARNDDLEFVDLGEVDFVELEEAGAGSRYFAIDLLRDVVVVETGPESPAGTSLTVLVRPGEAEVLRIAEHFGEVAALVRGRRASNPERPTMISADEAFAAVPELNRRRAGRLEERSGPEYLDDGDVRFEGEARIMTIPERIVADDSVVPEVGDRIDVTGTFYVEDQEVEPTGLADSVYGRGYVANGLLQRVAVVGRDGDEVAVVVTPPEARLLWLAGHRGELDFAIRSPEDGEVHRYDRYGHPLIRRPMGNCEILPEPAATECRKRMEPDPDDESIEIIR